MVGWLAAAVGLDAYGGRGLERPNFGAIVVAGAGVMPGGVPSDALVARADVAVALWREGRAPRVAFTGGVGDWGPAESVVGAGLAVRAGVPEAAIVREERSTSTEENAAALREVLGDVPIVVVTDRYHVLRCERVFGRYFAEVEVVGAVSPPVVRWRGAVREVAAVVYYAARGRL
ncbi:MAG: YdcF family protein [Myxococcota bacterium]